MYPHQYLKVNTIFEVARQHGLMTDWSDRHPAYEILDGPSGNGVQDFFTPEINSAADGVVAAVLGVPVETTRVAPTILALLHLNPRQLQAVQQEGTGVLSGL